MAEDWEVKMPASAGRRMLAHAFLYGFVAGVWAALLFVKFVRWLHG